MAEVRVGVDARPLCHPGTGIYRYASQLLRRMFAMGGQWYLYSPQPYDTAAFAAPNVQHSIAGIPAAVRASQSAQFFFPRWMRRDELDVFWGPRHQLPVVMPAGLRSVVTIHDFVWKEFGKTMRFPGRQIEAYFMPRALAKATDISVVSQFTRNEVEKYYPQFSPKVSVVPGASLLQGLGNSAIHLQDGPGYFLFVGTMEPRKNLPRLLRAYQRFVRDSLKPRKLMIVGGQGWGKQDTQQLVLELSLQDHVKVLGKLDDAELEQMYLGAHALVMPSLYEGYGLPIVEALSAGVPVITSRESAMSEVAGAAGLLVDPLSEQEIANALLALSDDPSIRTELSSHAGLESQRYDWDRSAAKMYRILAGTSE